MRKATLVLLALILAVAFTGVCEARHTFNNSNLLIGVYIPPTLNQPYGFPVMVWDGYVVISSAEEYTGWHTTCIGASFVDKSPKPVRKPLPPRAILVPPPKVLPVLPPQVPPVIVKKILVLPPVFFGVNNKSVKCDASTIPILDELVRILKDNPFSVVIIGYTDTTGTEAGNLKLSEKRALNVQQYLIDHGISKDRLSVKALGQANPIADNKTKEGRSKNRRVEFTIVK